jgi:DNA helicase-2/ATP-dependent DNA helicase PcrA
MCSQYSSISDLLNDIDALNQKVKESQGEKVKLSTIHRAKGLEFPVVFIIGCNDLLLPHYRNDNIDDEKRLFYVGITRAKNELYLSWTSQYNNNFAEISPFIECIKGSIDVIADNKSENTEEEIS